MKRLTLTNDANGNVVFAFPSSDMINARSLSASVEETVTVPPGATFCLFSADDDFYIRMDGTATVPGDVNDGTASELNPTLRNIKDVTTIHIIAPTSTTTVTLSFYK